MTTQLSSWSLLRKLSRGRLLGLPLLSFFLLSSALAWAEDVVVVLSSNLKPYQETLSGVRAVYGGPLSVLQITDRGVNIPFGTRLVVAIGGKAALQSYPSDVAFVYCLSPGILLPDHDRKGPTAKIYMTPPATVVLSKIKELQPNLKGLGILGLSESRDEFNADMEEEGAKKGVAVVVEKMHTPGELPDRLRSLRSHIQAIWIPPDPRLITPQNFNLIKEFCLANHIAFYVPTVELVEQGATASVASSFDDIGRSAGQMVQDMLSAASKGGKIYPLKPRVAINVKSAAESGLKLSPEQLQKADKLVQ
jgi:hypothetical protein